MSHRSSSKELGCLEGTREELLRNVMEWLRPFLSLSQEPQATGNKAWESVEALWLHGPAGSGKSAIANAIMKETKEAGFYLSYIFCERDDPDLSDPKKVFPTLAYQIAMQHDEYRNALVENFKSVTDTDDIVTGEISEQFELLFRNLLLRGESPSCTHVIVIDGLDECGESGDQKRLARKIIALAELAPWIKVLVTSRSGSKSAIKPVFDFATCCKSININYDEAQTNSDIRLYIGEKLRTINGVPTPDTSDVDNLVIQAAGHFIWCSTVARYLENSADVESALQQFLSTEVQGTPIQRLYSLYDAILADISSSDHGIDACMLHTVLGFISVTAGNRFLTTHVISTFLRSDHRYEQNEDIHSMVEDMTQALKPVLYEDNNVIRVHNSSFLDFVRDKIDRGVAGWDTSEFLHRLAFRSCMSTLERELEFNICRLNDSFLLNRDVPDLREKIMMHVSDLLQYSALFWLVHLSKSGLEAKDEEAGAQVSGLLKTTNALFWLEVLSLLNAVPQGTAILRECVVYFTVFLLHCMLILMLTSLAGSSSRV